MLIRVNENMDNLLKEIEQTWDLNEIRKISVQITSEVYIQWKDNDGN